ncbi:hypothetical protein PS9374_05789 [Planomonospora sphaerica]|uniref:Uncharacterized protein n=1 Tax=Planomonospora sphaerica TaxID=161355 RepID=A0A171DMC9_9ACTN|nr:hypothetical protein [Planomonospora sphaerica]GAT70109.1 hypothetical protein PS9374_05789 [Planomonospora sphaerica]
MTTTQSGSPATPARSALFSDRRFQLTLAAFWILMAARTLVSRYADQDLLSGFLTGLFVVTAVALVWQFARARR